MDCILFCIRITIADIFKLHGIILWLLCQFRFRQRLNVQDAVNTLNRVNDLHFLLSGISNLREGHRKKRRNNNVVHHIKDQIRCHTIPCKNKSGKDKCHKDRIDSGHESHHGFP